MLLLKTQDNVFLKIWGMTKKCYWTHWHYPHELSVSVPNAFQYLWMLSAEPLLSFWKQLQCITVLSWQQGIVMELSSCTHKRKQNWLTLHNAPWVVGSLFGNADEHGMSLIREQTFCRTLNNLEIPSFYKWSTAFFSKPYADGALSVSLSQNYTCMFVCFFRTRYMSLRFETSLRLKK